MSRALHTEIHLETEICEHLASSGWLYDPADSGRYDRQRALYPDDVLAWVKASQPQAWETLTKNHGATAGETLLTRLRQELDKRGTLDVLRDGIDLLGLKQRLKLAEFKPAFALNSEILARYKQNRLRVVRQVRYSVVKEDDALDLVLFLNGVPVATAELKTDFTQSITDAIDQYRFDRPPKANGKVEPLLSFPGGALVHFAVSNQEAHMVTKLAGERTRFLPFNKGNDGGAGNPPDPVSGHRTAYLWKEVWEPESWLEILGRYMVAERHPKTKVLESHVFPRFHQLDVTRKLQAAILADGPGTKYLIQHSAGSGKTKSIAWTAHFLGELHDEKQEKVFDTVLVVSDRNVIDSQLRDELISFQRTQGVVAEIKGEHASKSAELTEALSGDKKIVVVTIQTFPFALEEVRRQAATKGKRFAVIADEAHSSQTGEAATKLKEVLSAEEIAALGDGGEVSTEDILAAQMAVRSDEKGITFVAFTATPKQKTMEIFGTRPDPSRKPGNDNVPRPFHVYSMRQAIEEGFILDVLQNYTPYSLAFRLAHEGKERDDKEVEKSAALKKLMGWVKLHAYNIAQKVAIVVEHYREHVAPLLGGKAKAMVVVASRVEAVRWKLAIEKYIKEKGYPIRTLVAFSGEVRDEESGPDPFTEANKTLNPDLKGDIRNAFATDEYRILLVANKFQTGFDQPLLCGMYVDKRLAGIQAVQTLSRLNRAYPGKDTTYVVDFVNEPGEVLEAFKMYYETATLESTTDPNLVYTLRAKLDATGYYDEPEIERVVAAELNPKSKQSDLQKAIDPVANRLVTKFRMAQEAWRAAEATGDAKTSKSAKEEMDALVQFKGDLGTFVRLYTFLSQIFDYGQTAVEKRAIFYKRLLPLLELGRERQGIDLSKVVLTHHQLRDQGTRKLALTSGSAPKLEPITEAGGGVLREKETAYLSQIIEKVNDLFEGQLTDEDKLGYVRVLKEKVLESSVLREQAANNTKEQFASSPDLKQEILSAIMAALDAHTAMSTQALNSETVQAGLRDILLNQGRLYESLRDAGSTGV